jgi:hypothetical protein
LAASDKGIPDLFFVASPEADDQMPRFETARFHNLTGPAELFARVRFKMQDVRVLKVHARHVQDRSYERDAPLDRLQNFDPDRWRLMTAEVRTD